MRRLIYGAFLLTITLFLGLCGCGSDHNEISAEELTAYLENKYQEKFTLKSSEEFSPNGKRSDTRYTFESASGINCHISKVYGGGFIGYRYSYREDYPVMYLREHPDLIAELSEGNFEVDRTDADDGYCFETEYVLYLDSYDEIEPILVFIDLFLAGAEAIPDSGYTLSDYEIISLRPGITVGIREDGVFYPLAVSYRYPTESNSDTGCKEDFLEGTQETYVKLVREGHLSETLSEDLMNLYPASAICDITYQDEIVISSMVYHRESGEYALDQSCTEYESCEFYPDRLGGLLRTLGWSEKVSKRSVVWSKGTDEVELCLKGYGKNKTEMYCFKNGEEYQVCGRLAWQSGANPIVTLTESDLQYLFGMDFEFDQMNLTGRLILD